MNCNLNFYYKPGALSKDVNVVLVFDPPSKLALSSSQNRVAWRTANLTSVKGSPAQNAFSVDYAGRLGFSVAQLTDGNVVHPNSLIEMKLGENTDLKVANGETQWSKPINGGVGTIIRATNNTGVYQNIIVGTIKDIARGFSTLTPTFMWKVGAGMTVEADFHPVLKMYVNLDYQQGEFMDGNITSAEPIWTCNLATLASNSNWAFFETDQGGYAVKKLNF